MTTDGHLRVSDAERDDVARQIQTATAEGRLTLEEADERLGGVYASRFRHELAELVADLPRAEPAVPVGRAATTGTNGPGEDLGQRALLIHAAVVAVISALLIGRWAASDVAYFWPIFPMFWLAMSLVVHAGRR